MLSYGELATSRVIWVPTVSGLPTMLAHVGALSSKGRSS
jgi:hypothetical protein